MRTMRQREPMRRAGCVISMLLVMSADARRSQQNAVPVDSVTGAPAVCSNQTMALIGEVSKVFGPRLFAVAAPGIGAETLVFVPGWRIVTIRTGLPVCILGTIKLTPAIDLMHEWGSFDSDRSPVPAYPTTLVAERVTSATRNLIVAAAEHVTSPDSPEPSTAASRTLTDIDMLANSTDIELVGRSVSLRNVRIGIVGSGPGFWIASGDEEIFVLPADEVHPQSGQRVNLKGVVLQLPEGMTNRLGDYGSAHDEAIYVYASQFRTLSRRSGLDESLQATPDRLQIYRASHVKLLIDALLSSPPEMHPVAIASSCDDG